MAERKAMTPTYSSCGRSTRPRQTRSATLRGPSQAMSCFAPLRWDREKLRRRSATSGTINTATTSSTHVPGGVKIVVTQDNWAKSGMNSIVEIEE